MKRNEFHADPYETTGRYVHFVTQGAYHPYLDGWSQASKDYPTYRTAAARLFSGYGAGGYVLTYYPLDTDDGDMSFQVCGDCALELWLENPKQRFHVEHGDNDVRYSQSVTCESCQEVIDPQRCPECGDLLTERTTGTWNDAPLPLLAHGHGYVIHGQCMAKLVTRGEATHIGRGTYRVTGMWAEGEYRAEYLEG